MELISAPACKTVGCRIDIIFAVECVHIRICKSVRKCRVVAQYRLHREFLLTVSSLNCEGEIIVQVIGLLKRTNQRKSLVQFYGNRCLFQIRFGIVTADIPGDHACFLVNVCLDRYDLLAGQACDHRKLQIICLHDFILCQSFFVNLDIVKCTIEIGIAGIEGTSEVRLHICAQITKLRAKRLIGSL